MQTNGKPKLRCAGVFEKCRGAKQQMFEHAPRLFARAVVMMALEVRCEKFGSGRIQRNHALHAVDSALQGDYFSVGRIRSTGDRDVCSRLGRFLGEDLADGALDEMFVGVANCTLGLQCRRRRPRPGFTPGELLRNTIGMNRGSRASRRSANAIASSAESTILLRATWIP